MDNLQFVRSAIDAGGCVSSGWNLVKQNYGLYIGITIIGMILTGCIPCVSFFLVGPIMGGIFFVISREMRGETVDFGMMFRGFDKFVPLMVIGLVQSIPEATGQVIRVTADLGQLGLEGLGRDGSNTDFYQSTSDTFPIAIAGGLLAVIIIVAGGLFLFGIIWKILLFFSIPLAMEHDIGPVDAMKLSARAAMSNVGGLLLLLIIEFLLAILGILMLCIGIVFVIPIIFAANVCAYRQVFPMFEQHFRNEPPSPDAYGNFGRA